MKRFPSWFVGGASAFLAWFYAVSGGVIPLPVPIRITAGPVVMIVSEDEYAVLWATSKRGTGSLVVTTDGEESAFHDAAGGTIRSGDRLHVVRIPKTVLDGCDGYRVESRYSLFNPGYFGLMGGRAESGENKFRGYAGQEQIRALFFTDIHGNRKQALRNAAALTQDAPADLVIFAGDIPDDGLLTRRAFVKGILGLAAPLSEGEIPVLYCRGNHEARGQWATEIGRYFPTRTGEMYYTADYGPIAFTVLDTGEDKDDGHPEYFGLADFAAYRAREKLWLDGLATAGEYEYRVCVSHADNLDRAEFYDDWYRPLRDNLGVTHAFCGHGHSNRAWENGGLRHYQDGGPDTGSLLLFEGGEIFAMSVASPNEIHDFGRLEAISEKEEQPA